MDEQQEQEQETTVLDDARVAAELHAISLAQRAGYFVKVGLPSLVGLEVIGAGAYGLLLALGAAGVVAYFADDIEEWRVKHFHGKRRAPRLSRPSSRRSISWWLGQGDDAPVPEQVSPDGADDTEEFPDDEDVEDRKEPDRMSDAMMMQSFIEEDGMNLSPWYQPNIDGFLSQRVFIAGISGSGKSNLGAVLIEELGRWSVPLILFDTENEYAPIADRRYLPRGLAIDASNLDVEHGREFAAYILDNALQVVINLQSYDDADAATLMVGIIDGLNDWQEARSEDDRVSCMVMLDEAAHWLPQQVSESSLDRETLNLLQRAFFDKMVRRGRKRGLGLILATQRVAEIDKRALQASWMCLCRQSMRRDLQEYGYLGLDKDEVLSLRNGECFVYSPNVSALRVQTRLRHSPHGAHTPGLDSVKRHQQRIAMQHEASRAAPNFASVGVVERDTGEHPALVSDSVRSGKQVSLEFASSLWNDGASSVRKLAAALHEQGYTKVTYYQANELYRRLRDRRLIEID